MRVLVVLNHSGFFRHLDSVARSLCARGHEVEVLTRMAAKWGDDPGYRAEMEASLAPYKTGSYKFKLHRRNDRLAPLVKKVHATVDYGLYVRPQHNSPQLRKAFAADCPPGVRRFLETRPGRRLAGSDAILRTYYRLWPAVPPDPRILSYVAKRRPDVVVACPVVYGLRDIEYLRAARKLGIPSATVVASWDNLSTKGAFHVLSERVLVWNERLADEAAAIHAIPRDRLVSTGAPKFDRYFGAEPSRGREAFCARIGADPSRPYLLYLGSSGNIAADEPAFVGELARAMREHPATRHAALVVRPHPLNAQAWADYRADGITVFPREGERPDLPEPLADYFDTLAHSAATIGINTSAFLEAAIADRPCLSIVSDRHRSGQMERGHFQHLLSGGFLKTVPDFETAAVTLGDVLEGRDERHAQRRRFVADFIRPGGLSRPAGDVTADAILELANGTSH